MRKAWEPLNRQEFDIYSGALNANRVGNEQFPSGQNPNTLEPGNRAENKAVLRRIERLEDFARDYDQFEILHAKDFPSWQVSIMREHFANTYVRLTGIHPTKRHELRKRLEEGAYV